MTKDQRIAGLIGLVKSLEKDLERGEAPEVLITNEWCKGGVRCIIGHAGDMGAGDYDAIAAFVRLGLDSMDADALVQEFDIKFSPANVVVRVAYKDALNWLREWVPQRIEMIRREG
jgi:hypothetical protein